MKFITGSVVGKRIWGDGLFTLQVAAPGVAAFEAGQYLQVGVARPEKHVHRPYSVASPHGETLDFFIVRVDDGRLTPTLWSLTIGDRVDVSEKAIGSFTLSQVHRGEDLWLVSTGTGLAPYVAMLRESRIWERFSNVHIVHGVRHAGDLAYQDEMAAYRQKYGSRFAYLPAVSRERTDGALFGRIPTVLAGGQLEQAAGRVITPQHSAVMLCGNPSMLEEMQKVLESRGLTRHTHKEPGNIIVERYW